MEKSDADRQRAQMEVDLWIFDPERYMDVFGGGAHVEPMDDEMVLFPASDDEFDMMIEQFESEGFDMKDLVEDN